MNLRQDNIQWQEWIFRVGCWLSIIGIHLWLLLFMENSNSLVWQNNHNNARSLSLGFSANTPSASLVNDDLVKPSVKKSEKTAPVDNQRYIVDKKEQKDIIKSKKKIKKINRKIEKEIATVNPDVSKEEKTVDSQPKEAVSEIDTAAVVQNEPLANDKQLVENNNDRESSLSAKAIIYNPSLLAPPVPPSYPEIARRKKQQGTVWLDVFLDDQGKQRQLAVHKSSGVSSLDKAALRAVKQWRFSQYQKEMQSQLVTIRIPIEFSLN